MTTLLNSNSSLNTGNILDRAQKCIEGMMTRNKAALAKAAFTTTDLTTGGGLLAPQQAMRFISLMRIQPTLLREVRLVPLKGPTDRIDRIGFTGRILHTATENTALPDNKKSKPTTSKIEMSPKLFKAHIQLGYEALQDSIEGGQNVRGNRFEQLVMQLMVGQGALDLEEFFLLSSIGNIDADLAQFDGWLKLAEDQNSYDHGGASVSKAFFKNMFLQHPKAYRSKKRELRFVISPNMDVEWADEQADKQTTTGDSVAWGDKHPDRAYSIPMLVSNYMPEESGASSNLGKSLITHPKNMVGGIWRNMFLEADRNIADGAIDIVLSVRVDGKYEQVEGTVVGKNVKVA